MYGKLVHRPPFGHHCHAPRPPFGDPREVGERYLGHPELTDYWIKPYLLEALKHYPRLDDSCVVEGLWTFANSILLKNYKAAKRVPPTFDDPEVTHKIAFLDSEDVELGSIKFWRKVDSTFGIDVKLGNGGISIVGDNDNPTMSLVNTPVNGAPKEIVNVEYLNQAFSSFTNGLNDLTNRVESLEDLYDNHVKPLITDSNDNYRDVHTTIHADASDANLPTCGAVYQYGKGISDALNSRIDGLANGLSDLNNALNGLSSRVGSIANDVANLQNSGGGSGGGGSGASGGGSNNSYIFAYPSGTVEDGSMPKPEIINAWDIITGDHIASAVEVSANSGENHPDIITYTIDQNSSLDSNTFVAGYWENEAVYNPTILSSSDSYRCIAAPEVTQGSGAGDVGDAGDTRPWVRVKAGVFQRIGGSGSGGPVVSDITWAAVSKSWSQIFVEKVSSNSYSLLPSHPNTSFLGNISGVGSNYNVPQFTVSVGARGQFVCDNCVDVGETFTCTDTSTNVSNRYIPLRLMITYTGTSGANGGLYYLNVSAKVWYRDAYYTLSPKDISDINEDAYAFQGSKYLARDISAMS